MLRRGSASNGQRLAQSCCAASTRTRSHSSAAHPRPPDRRATFAPSGSGRRAPDPTATAAQTTPLMVQTKTSSLVESHVLANEPLGCLTRAGASSTAPPAVPLTVQSGLLPLPKTGSCSVHVAAILTAGPAPADAAPSHRSRYVWRASWKVSNLGKGTDRVRAPRTHAAGDVVPGQFPWIGRVPVVTAAAHDHGPCGPRWEQVLESAGMASGRLAIPRLLGHRPRETQRTVPGKRTAASGPPRARRLILDCAGAPRGDWNERVASR